jgi:hypothetical protein
MRAHWQTRNVVLGLTVAGLLALLGAFVAAPAAPAAKRGKIKVCVAKKGPDKGAMRFSKKGKCKRGERKLSWAKKGKAGAQGAAGPQGPAGSAANVDELLALIEAQQTTIDGLTQEVADLTTQVSTLAGQVLALEDILGGLTNAELTDAVNSVAAVQALCGAVEGLVPLFSCPTAG